MALGWKAAKLSWREWEGEIVVFSVNSGNTHLISPAAGDVVRLLEKEVLSATEISDRLMAGLSSDEEVISNVETLLKNLDHLGLIEPVSQ